MSITTALLLGIVQGFTEFLPVSSSGHLVLLQHYLGLREAATFFNVLVHAGTLGAVVIFFRKELNLIVLSIVKLRSQDAKLLFGRHIILAVVLGTIPTALLGFGLYKVKGFFMQGVPIPALMLVFTGVFLWWGEKRSVSHSEKKQKVGLADALFIGLMQGVSLIPGISRSGITISSGLMRNLDRKLSFNYSFFLFIPVVIGALILESTEVNAVSAQITLPYLAGTLTAFATGIAALGILRKVLGRKKLSVFSWYCWILGGGLLVLEGIKMVR